MISVRDAARRWRALAVASAAASLVGCGSAPPAGDPSEDAGPGGTEEPQPDMEPVPVAVNTNAPERATAGDELEVSCVLLDETGAEIAPADEPNYRLRFAPEAAVERTDGGAVIAVRAGQVQVTCALPAQSLVDTSSPVIEIEPGEVAQLDTHLDTDRVTAGGDVTASCDAFDAWGNRVNDAAPALRADPSLEDNPVDGLSATFTRAGTYELYCDLPGVNASGAALEVVPDLPASLVISRVPDRPVYGIGEIVEIAHIVVDRHDNPVPEAQVTVESAPGADVTDGPRFRYFRDGSYELTATVTGPTAENAPLAAEATVVVDGNGPAISCDAPLDGAILDHSPGEPVTFAGTTTDLSGVSHVRVNGSQVAVDGAGAFSLPVPTEFGINFVDLAATDELGKESTRTCSFLVADRFADEDEFFADAVSLKMTQPAIDDGDRSGGPSSLADLLDTVLNSNGLAAAVHDELLAANPIKPSSCDRDGPFGTCALRTEMEYLDSEFPGPNTIGLDLVDGGLSTQISFRDAALQLHITGQALGIDFSSTGWVTVDSVVVDLTFDAFFDSGRPTIAIRPGSVDTAIGNIDADFSGISGSFIELVVSIAEGRVRDLLADQVTDLVTGSFGEILDGFLANLDISALGTTFQVPRPGGGPAIPLQFDPGFSSLSATGGRMLFGLGTRFSAPIESARPSLGAPVRAPVGPEDPDVSAPAAASIHAGILNQAMHALWRARFFDATITGDGLGGSVPEGASATLAVGLPPVVTIPAAGQVELALGDVALTLDYPGLFPEPIEMRLGMRATVLVSAGAEDVAFSDFVLEELHFTSDRVSLDADTRDIIEGFLARVLGRIVERALNDALPALPIPSFELPDSVADYGLPAGAVLGVDAPVLSTPSPHFVLTGSLTIR